MEDWFATYGITVVAAVVGIVVCTGGGLLSLTPDPEKPAQFVPVYIIALAVFLGGLGMVMWCEQLADIVRENYLDG